MGVANRRAESNCYVVKDVRGCTPTDFGLCANMPCYSGREWVCRIFVQINHKCIPAPADQSVLRNRSLDQRVVQLLQLILFKTRSPKNKSLSRKEEFEQVS